MRRPTSIWRLLRFGAAFAVFGFLTAAGYLRGYHAIDERTRQTPVPMPHKMGDLLGPDYSAAGMQQTTQSLITLVQSLHLEDANSAIVLNPVRAASAFSAIHVTTYPYKHKEIEQLFKQLRNPPNG